MMEIALSRVVCGTREIPRDVLIERAACATGLGDAIGVVLRNNFAFFEASFAAQRLGSYSLPVNWHGKTQEIAYVLNDCGAGAVVAHTGLLSELHWRCRRGAALCRVGAAEIMTFLRGRLADFKVPRVIKFETALPREDSGKIIKRKLREPYCVDIGRNI